MWFKSNGVSFVGLGAKLSFHHDLIVFGFMAQFVLLLLFSINLLNYIDRQLLYAVLPLIKTDLHLSDTQLGSLASAFMVVYMLAAPLLAYLADRQGRKKWLIGGVFAWSIATFFTGTARTFFQLFTSRAAVGIGESSYGAISPPFIAEHFSEDHRGRVLSFFSMAIPVGSALGYIIGGYIGAHYGWRTAFWGAGVIGIPLGFVALWIRDARSSISPPGSVLFSHYKHLFSNKSFLSATMSMALMTFTLGGLAVWMPTFLTRQWNVSLAHAGVLFGGVTVVAGALGSLSGGFMADKLLNRYPSSYFLISGIGLVVALPLAWAGLSQSSMSVALLYFCLAEFCAFLNTGPLNAVIANVTALPARTMAFALNIFIIHALGDAISPLIIGVISDRWHLSVALMAAAIPLGVGGLVSLAGTKFYAADTGTVRDLSS